MIDFDKLNMMVNEVNNVISDVKSNTKQIKKEGNDIIKTLWSNAHNKLAHMYKIYQNTIDNENSFAKRDLKIEIYIEDGIIKFESGGITIETIDTKTKKLESYYCIGSNYNSNNYENYNHSHPAVIYFHHISSIWDDVESDIEEQFVNGIHSILKQRSENAHKENAEAHEFLNSISNLI